MNKLLSLLPPVWCDLLADETAQEYFKNLDSFLREQRKLLPIYPSEALVFRALEICPPQNTRVIILGQDPYHGENQAHGLAFSVPPGEKFPPSLRNIFKELKNDLNIDPPFFGDLSKWGKQGVLLLNTVLTVVAHKPGSHQNKGWENFTDAIIRQLSEREEQLVFILWGSFAQKKAALIDENKHAIICSAHPSPLSAYRGFFNSKPFSACNLQLKEWCLKPIDWSL
tara:strand:- start:1469 stop:2146 length:678 start_codon:yes stop_codon:yes gene_type:complete